MLESAVNLLYLISNIINSQRFTQNVRKSIYLTLLRLVRKYRKFTIFIMEYHIFPAFSTKWRKLLAFCSKVPGIFFSRRLFIVPLNKCLKKNQFSSSVRLNKQDMPHFSVYITLYYFHILLSNTDMFME